MRVFCELEFLAFLIGNFAFLMVIGSFELQGEAKNFDKENLHRPKLTDWFARLLLSARASAILLQFFCKR
jgi:hypothetical protein